MSDLASELRTETDSQALRQNFKLAGADALVDVSQKTTSRAVVTRRLIAVNGAAAVLANKFVLDTAIVEDSRWLVKEMICRRLPGLPLCVCRINVSKG